MKRTSNFIEEQKAKNAPGRKRKQKPSGRHKQGFRGPSPDVGKATQFKPGEIRNPTGKNQHDLAASIARAIFENNTEAIYESFTRALKCGNAYTFKELAERGYGKIAEKHDLTLNAGAELLAAIKRGHERAKETKQNG